MSIIYLSEIRTVSMKCLLDETMSKSKIENSCIYHPERKRIVVFAFPSKVETDAATEFYKQIFHVRGDNCFSVVEWDGRARQGSLICYPILWGWQR